MSEFESYPTSAIYVNASNHWNALLDHGLEKTASYIVRVNGVYYEAINGSSGKISFGGSANAGGATGTDARIVIQAAIDASATGQAMYVKNGQYDISGATLLFDHSKIRFLAESKNAILKLAANQTINILTITANYVTIKGFTLDGFKASQIDGGNEELQCGIKINSASQGIIEDNLILNNKKSSINSLSSNSIITKNDIRDNDSWGIYLNAGAGNIVSQNYVAGNFNDGIIAFQSTRNLINTNRVVANKRYGIHIGLNARENDVIGNEASYNLGTSPGAAYGVGINIVTQQPDSKVTVSGNITNNNQGGTGGCGILVEASGGATVSANMVYGNTGNGIELVDCVGDPSLITIMGNTVHGNVNHGIWIHDSSNVVLTGNNGRNGVWGLKEEGTSDYNIITSSKFVGDSGGGISTVGANTKVNLVYNGNTWIP